MTMAKKKDEDKGRLSIDAGKMMKSKLTEQNLLLHTPLPTFINTIEVM